MDGDNTAKTFEHGAHSALKETEHTQGMHESVNPAPAMGEKTTGTGTSIFSKDGAVGSMFNGGTAHKVGGPFDKDGAIGQHFNADGKIGGMAQDLAKKNEAQ